MIFECRHCFASRDTDELEIDFCPVCNGYLLDTPRLVEQ